MSMEVRDVVVIGGGIVGCSAALFLARAGLDVCVVEKKAVGLESSGRAAGGVRQNFRPAEELPLAMRTVQLWSALAEESDLDFEYRHHGNLGLAWSESEAVEMEAMVERQRATGLECYYLSREETRELVPGVMDGYLGGAYCPSDGFAEPYLSCLAWAGAAKRAGATICEHREVTGFQVVGDRYDRYPAGHQCGRRVGAPHLSHGRGGGSSRAAPRAPAGDRSPAPLSRAVPGLRRQRLLFADPVRQRAQRLGKPTGARV
jgi:glycine/D-amino acid oxidase-like deaminating enzyme